MGNSLSDIIGMSKKSRLLRGFDRMASQARQILVLRYGDEQASVLIKEVRDEYEALIREMPAIRNVKLFNQFLTATAQFLAIYRVLNSRGRTIDEVGELIWDISKHILDSYPAFLTRMFGYMSFSPSYLKKLQKRAAQSQQRLYAGDYVFYYVAGDGKAYDYGVDYTECCTCKFLQKQGAIELAPYICAIDILYSEKLGWGLKRTMTLAEGNPKCDFRFKKGGKTQVQVPEYLKHIVS